MAATAWQAVGRCHLRRPHKERPLATYAGSFTSARPEQSCAVSNNAANGPQGLPLEQSAQQQHQGPAGVHFHGPPRAPSTTSVGCQRECDCWTQAGSRGCGVLAWRPSTPTPVRLWISAGIPGICGSTGGSMPLAKNPVWEQRGGLPGCQSGSRICLSVQVANGRALKDVLHCPKQQHNVPAGSTKACNAGHTRHTWLAASS